MQGRIADLKRFELWVSSFEFERVGSLELAMETRLSEI
jgi:hypothetical protein